MDMTLVKAPVNPNNYSYAPAANVPEEASVTKPTPANKSEAGENQSQLEEKGKEKLTREDVDQLTEHLNKFMKTFNTDLQFELHEGTNRMIIRFVDQKDHKVIKEFPPHELLDTLAAISDYVGLLLDKKV